MKSKVMEEPRIHKYYQHSNEKNILKNSIENIIQGLSNFSAIDVGAGRGEIAEVLYKKSSKLTLLDRERSYLEIWKSHYPNANYEIGHIKDFAFKKYDIVLFSHGLYYHDVSSWDDICKKMFESTASGGKLIIIMNRESGDWWDVVHKFYNKEHWESQFNYTPWVAFRKSMMEWGANSFQTIKCQVKFTSIQELVEYTLHACLSLRKPCPRNAVQEVTNHYLQAGFPAHKNITLNYDQDIFVLNRDIEK